MSHLMNKDKMAIGLFVVLAAWIVYRAHAVPPEERHVYVSLLTLILMVCFAWLCLRIAQWKNLSNTWKWSMELVEHLSRSPRCCSC